MTAYRVLPTSDQFTTTVDQSELPQMMSHQRRLS